MPVYRKFRRLNPLVRELRRPGSPFAKRTERNAKGKGSYNRRIKSKETE